AANPGANCGLGLIEENHTSLMNGGPRKISPFFVPSTIVNMVAGHLTIMYGLRGPSISIATACITQSICHCQSCA
ncbi:beta-ketoacyl synthase N-terminal-like domain-containing protein, partial [Escherichia sp. TWPC-MK]